MGEKIYELVGVLISLAVLVVMYFKWSYKYWEKKGVPFIEPRIPFGNVQNPISQKQPSFIAFRDFYRHFKSKGQPFGGVYLLTSPGMVLVDPDVIRNVMATDFQYFTNRRVVVSEKHDPISAHLFNLEGEAWRNMRTKLTPTFTSGKMKMMFETLMICADHMTSYLECTFAKSTPVDIKHALTCYTTDVIGSCAFGIECNSFKDANSEFIRVGRKIFVSTLCRKVRLILMSAFPELCKRLGITTFEKCLSNFYWNVVKQTVEYREDTCVKRKDFLQLLIEMKKNDSNPHGITFEQIVAQSFVFFLAGFETSSTLMTFTMFELAQNPDVQEKARKEIRGVLADYDGKLTYEGVMRMKYLGQVLDEALRKYPPVPVLHRQCVKDYTIPGTKTVIEKNTVVFVPVVGLHKDPDYYPDPEKFDPDRFSEENRASRHPFVHLPFGEGPRNCIGLRFGLMESRVGVASILNKYKVSLNGKTQVPFEMSPNSFILAPKNNIFLDIEKIF